MTAHRIPAAGYAAIRRAKANHDDTVSITPSSPAFFGVHRGARIAIMAVAPLLMAALWMDTQPSTKPYEAPVLVPPAGSVPVTGREIVSQDIGRTNPLTPTEAALVRGKALFAVNCTMCHGVSSVEHGPVGKKLKPPPPGLDRDLVRNRTDAHIFTAVTFGFGRMPPFKDTLTQQERWELVNYLRTRT